MTTRREAIKTLAQATALIALAPTLPKAPRGVDFESPDQLKAYMDERGLEYAPDAPDHPVNKDFESPEELQQYMADLDEFLEFVEDHTGSDPLIIAESLSGLITHLVSVCLALKDNKELAEQVYDALRLLGDSKLGIACIAADYRNNPNCQFLVDEQELAWVRRNLWGHEYIAMPRRAYQFADLVGGFENSLPFMLRIE